MGLEIVSEAGEFRACSSRLSIDLMLFARILDFTELDYKVKNNYFYRYSYISKSG